MPNNVEIITATEANRLLQPDSELLSTTIGIINGYIESHFSITQETMTIFEENLILDIKEETGKEISHDKYVYLMREIVTEYERGNWEVDFELEDGKLTHTFALPTGR